MFYIIKFPNGRYLSIRDRFYMTKDINKAFEYMPRDVAEQALESMLKNKQYKDIMKGCVIVKKDEELAILKNVNNSK